MATDSKTYPKISRKMWWLVRGRLNKTIPSAVTPVLITSLATMTEASARSNVITPLRDLGLLDAENKPTELAARWRHDDEYKDVCLDIRKNVYPHELIEAFGEPLIADKNAIAKWFMKRGQVGEAAARMYADTYILLSQADPKGQSEALAAPTGASRPSKTSKPAEKAAPAAKRRAGESATPPLDPDPEPHQPHGARRLPAVHIDVQVHISPDTAPEQIDRIFESMAKHLGTFIK